MGAAHNKRLQRTRGRCLLLLFHVLRVGLLPLNRRSVRRTHYSRLWYHSEMSQSYDFKHVLNITDEELLDRWKQTFHPDGSFPEDIKTEVLRRAVLRVHESSKRLERLTSVLIILTVVLSILAAPPAFEVVSHFLQR